MKKTDYLIILALIVLSIYLAIEVYPPIRSRIEKNCNQIGGSYLGGHCIRSEYLECKSRMDSQAGNIALLPLRCAKYVEELYHNQY